MFLQRCLFYFQGEFYNIGQHQEPPFLPQPFSLPPQTNNMLYIGMSAFTINSAAFVYNRAGVLSLYVTDDMVRYILQTASSICLNSCPIISLALS